MSRHFLDTIRAAVRQAPNLIEAGPVQRGDASAGANNICRLDVKRPLRDLLSPAQAPYQTGMYA